MSEYWARWNENLERLMEPYQCLEKLTKPQEFPGADLLEYYKCLEDLMRPLQLIRANQEDPGKEVIRNYELLGGRLEDLTTRHPWFSEDESTRDIIELLGVLTTKQELEEGLMEEKIGGLERRIDEIEEETKS